MNKYSMDPSGISDIQKHVCNYDNNKQSQKFTDNKDLRGTSGRKNCIFGICNKGVLV